MDKFSRALKYLALLFGVLSALLLVDYFLPVKQVKEPLLFNRAEGMSSVRGGRTTGSYKVFTSSHAFYIDPYTYAKAEKNDVFLLELSPLFNKVHAYQIVDKTKEPTVFFFRRLKGLILPMFAVVLAIFSVKIDDLRLHMGALFMGILAVLMFI